MLLQLHISLEQWIFLGLADVLSSLSLTTLTFQLIPCQDRQRYIVIDFPKHRLKVILGEGGHSFAAYLFDQLPNQALVQIVRQHLLLQT